MSISISSHGPAGGGGDSVELAPVRVHVSAPEEQQQPAKALHDAAAAMGNGADGTLDVPTPGLKHALSSRTSSAVALPTLQDYISYIEMLYSDKCWRDAPSVPLTYDKLSYHLPLPADDTENPSVGKAFFDMFRKQATSDLAVFDDLTGHIPAGRMTLVLAPPGAGKSQFLKTLGGHMRHNKLVTGELLYDGLSADEQLKGGMYTEKLCALVAQGDVHMANLTVRETMQFALDNSVVPPTAELFGQSSLDPRLLADHKRKVDLLLSVLGMHECSETIAGNDMIRGVSGGQKKRLTIGEMMITNARVLLLDEPTTGLDAAVSRDIMVVLKKWCEVSGGSVIAALLQATPECFELYQDLILMREGVVLYHGPRAEVAEFMEREWGLVAPDDQDLADFIVDVLTNPEQQFRKQVRRLADGLASYKFTQPPGAKAAAVQPLNGQQEEGQQSNGAAKPEPSASHVRIHTGDDEDDAAAPVVSATKIVAYPRESPSRHANGENPITTAALLARYKASSYYQLQRAAVDRVQSERASKLSQLESVKAARTPYTHAQYGQLYTRGFATHTKLSLGRQFTLLKRDKQTAPPRAFSAIIQALIFGSLFFRLEPSNFYPKIGILLFSIMFFAMGNFTELPATFEGRNAVYKQVDAGMMPTISYMIAIALASVPIILIESALYTVILYFMVGLAEDAGRFFFCWLMLVLADLMFSTGFRAVCYRVVSIDQAQQVAMPIMNIAMIYSGFLILKPEIKDWQIEFFYLSPFSWLVRSLTLNEFNDEKYDELAFNGVRKGDFYMSNFGIDVESEWKWGGVGYVAGCVVLFTYLGARWLSNTRFDLLQGTKRAMADERTVNQTMVQNEQQQQLQYAPTLGAAAGAAAPAKDVTLQVRPASAVKGLAKMSAHSSQVQINSVLPFQPASFAFENISYSVPVVHTEGKDKGKTYQKQLLSNVTGFVKPGQLVALMGSSGAGKTTLIDVVAGRKTSGEITGEVLINGQPKSKNEAMFKRITGYCEQRDMHMPLATVRESLMFSATLRLPKTVSPQTRAEFVDELLDILELRTLADRIVGNEKYAGLSPGQLKLLTIGVELAANPAILFLDEPTSGLDSRAAVVVMRVVSKIAATGRAVLCTIHQPSSDVFFYFDSCLLLRSGGRTVFFGELGAEACNLVSYFEHTKNEAGELPKCPKGTNPASWMLDVIGAGLSGSLCRANAHKSGRHGGAAAKPFDYADEFDQSDLSKRQLAELQEVKKPAATSAELQIRPEDFDIPLSVQLRCVVTRGFVSYWRDSQMNLGRILMLVFISLIFGIVYVQLDETSYSGLTSKTAAVFSTAGFWAMLSAQTTLPNIFGERAVYYRERASNAYPSWIYSTTTALCEIPYVFFSSLLGLIIFYFMVGYQNDAELFFQFWCAISLLVLIESSFGQFAAALLPNFVVAIQLAGALNTLFFLFGGLFVRPADIPEGWRWFYYMNPIPKAIIAIIMPQFQCRLDDPYSVASGCPTIMDPVSGVETTVHAYVQRSWDTSYDNVFGRMIGWLVLTYFVFRLGIWASFRYINHLRR